MNQHSITVQIACTWPNIPQEVQLINWAEHALSETQANQEMTIRIVSIAEIQQLNHHYRQQDKPTNVLAFRADIPAELNGQLLGDVVICAEIVDQQAQQQNKLLDAHWAHMVIHGTLHLLGYDHIDALDADKMEAREITLLNTLGYHSPY